MTITMTRPVISKSVFFDAKPETVWAFLTDKDKLGTWYHPAMEDLKEGADYALYQLADDGAKVPIITGRVLEADAPNKLVTTFVIGPFNGKETTVTWVLDAVAGGTSITLTHEGVEEAAGDAALGLLMALDKGWDEHFASLRESVASGV